MSPAESNVNNALMSDAAGISIGMNLNKINMHYFRETERERERERGKLKVVYMTLNGAFGRNMASRV